MSGLSTDQVNLYIKDMYKVSRETYKETDTVHDKVFKTVSGVTGAGDKMTQLLGAGGLTRHTTEEQKITFKAPVEGWQYFVKYWTFSDGLALTKNAVEDTVKLGNLIKELAGTWGKSVRYEEETLGARVFNEGGNLTGDWVFNGSHTGNTATYGDMPYDNEPLFNLTGNTRSTKGGGTYYNSVASLTVTAANFETLYNLHTATNNRDERDRPMKNPCDTALCLPGANRFLLERIVDTSKGMPGGQLNDMNPYYKIIDQIIAWDYLESAEAAWFIGKRGSDGYQFHKRQAPEIRFFRDEDDLGYKASINIRMGILIKDFRCWSRGGGTSA
jgi:hypothetical protein